MNSWEDELRQHFPGYLLPASAREALPRDVAQRFLECIGGKPESLEALIAASALAPIADDIRAFPNELKWAANNLASRTDVVRVNHAGIVRGRIDPVGTTRNRLAGDYNRISSRVRHPNFDLPENVFLAMTAKRLAEVLRILDRSGVLVAKDGKSGWTLGFRDCAEALRHTLSSTAFDQVTETPLGSPHEQAARSASGAVYILALRIHEALKQMDATDPQRIARLVADGALAPLDEEKRFEIAVLIRLGRSIEQALAGKRYDMRRALIEKRRAHVFEFVLRDNALRIHYNQGFFQKLGPRDRGVQHYFNESGRLRPDIVLEFLHHGRRVRAIIVEAKHSPDNKYLKDGYEQALLYRQEYSDELRGWPMVILVVSAEKLIKGQPRREDEVIAIDWANWVPDVVKGLLEGFVDG